MDSWEMYNMFTSTVVFLWFSDEVVGVFTFTKATAGESLFKGTVLEKRPRILQAAAPTPGSEIYPEQQALHLSGQAVIFFTVLILLLALVLSVSSFVPAVGNHLSQI
jgi:hypothetical protein